MRLTERLKSGNYCSKNGDFYDLYDKLGQLEDIEDDLGIDLVTLFKALTQGIYWIEKEDKQDEIENGDGK